MMVSRLPHSRILLLIMVASLACVFAKARAATISQLNALSEFESHNNDRARGKGGELSRFQIPPKIWAHYTSSRDYTNAAVARGVAARICQEQEQGFRRATRRNPTNQELFLLWAAPSKFRSMHYQYSRVSSGTRKNAERFAAIANSRMVARR